MCPRAPASLWGSLEDDPIGMMGTSKSNRTASAQTIMINWKGSVSKLGTMGTRWGAPSGIFEQGQETYMAGADRTGQSERGQDW